MRRSLQNRPHFIEANLYAAFGNLPSRFNARKAATDNINMFRVTHLCVILAWREGNRTRIAQIGQIYADKKSNISIYRFLSMIIRLIRSIRVKKCTNNTYVNAYM